MRDFNFELKNLEFALTLAKEVFSVTKDEEQFKKEITRINSARRNLFNEYCAETKRR